MRRSFRLFVLALLGLGACTPAPEPASPAFWEIEAADGTRGWLIGTVHSLDRPAEWRGPEIDRALDAADLVLVEIANLEDGAAMNETFAKLARTPGLPPLSERVQPELRDELAAVLDRHDLSDTQFSETETWAAALMLAQAETQHLESAYGVDRAVIEAAGNLPVEELEGTTAQLALFDGLAEADQRDLLAAILRDATAIGGETTDLAQAWRHGDMDALTRETEKGLLADPELRSALFTGRNEAWTRRILSELAAGREPFVAVGAAHMAGPEGLPALLALSGVTVRRVQ